MADHHIIQAANFFLQNSQPSTLTIFSAVTLPERLSLTNSLPLDDKVSNPHRSLETVKERLQIQGLFRGRAMWVCTPIRGFRSL